jgi:Na+/H+ antiporter NhaC
MYQSAIIILCALIFSELLGNSGLQTGNYLAQLILPYISAHWVPLIIFIMSMIIAMGAGSSWGTIAIMFPISIPMVAAFAGQALPVPLQDIYLLLPTIGAVISGAVAGAQLSPIADPITMSSLSSGAYQIDHVKTQMPYIIPVIIGTGVSFAAAGFINFDGSTLNGLLCMLIGLCTSLSLLYTINFVSKKYR